VVPSEDEDRLIGAAIGRLMNGHPDVPGDTVQAQAASTATLLAELVRDCGARIVAANDAAAQAEPNANPTARTRHVAQAAST
jgi:hypothetical protein